jgi:hypothetical protein
MRHVLLGFDASLHSVKSPSSIKSSNRSVLNRSALPRLEMLSTSCAETPEEQNPLANQSASCEATRRKAGIVTTRFLSVMCKGLRNVESRIRRADCEQVIFVLCRAAATIAQWLQLITNCSMRRSDIWRI